MQTRISFQLVKLRAQHACTSSTTKVVAGAGCIRELATRGEDPWVDGTGQWVNGIADRAQQAVQMAVAAASVARQVTHSPEQQVGPGLGQPTLGQPTCRKWNQAIGVAVGAGVQAEERPHTLSAGEPLPEPEEPELLGMFSENASTAGDRTFVPNSGRKEDNIIFACSWLPVDGTPFQTRVSLSCKLGRPAVVKSDGRVFTSM